MSDKDDGSKDDTIGTIDQRLNLSALGEGTTGYWIRSEHGTIRLYVKLDRLADL